MTLDERIPLLDQVGVDMQVLSPAAAAPYLAEEAAGVEAARILNDCLTAVCHQYPGRFAVFASYAWTWESMIVIGATPQWLSGIRYRNGSLRAAGKFRQATTEQERPHW